MVGILNSTNDMLSDLASLFKIMGQKWRKSFFFLMIVSVSVAALDAISIIMFALASGREQEILSLGGVRAELAVILLILISTFIRGLLQYLQIKFSFLSAVILGDRIVRSFLNSGRQENDSLNDNKIISSITARLNTVSGNIILSLLQVFNFLSFIFLLISGLLYFNIYNVLVALIGLISVFSIIYVCIKPFLKKLGNKVNEANTRIVEMLNETTQVWQLIRLRMQEEVVANRYSALETAYRGNMATVGFLTTLPRYGVEILLALSLGAVLLVNSYSDSFNLMGIIAFGYVALRSIPMVQQAYNGITLMTSGHAALHEVIDIIAKLEKNKIRLKKGAIHLDVLGQIEVRNLVSQRIMKSATNPVCLKMGVGEKVVISGASGSGKTTLIDMLTGLTGVEDHKILYNGCCINTLDLKSLYKHIAYLPQVAPLVNGTVEQNLLQGHENGYDKNLYIDLLKLVGFTLDTGEVDREFLARQVGDRGKNISGGQRQRIQIINTLLAEKKFIILDEATSALDAEREIKLIQFILKQPNLTVIFVTHNEKLKQLFKFSIELNR